MWARGSFSGDGTPHTGSFGTVLLLYPSGGPPRALLIHIFAHFASAALRQSSSPRFGSFFFFISSSTVVISSSTTVISSSTVVIFPLIMALFNPNVIQSPVKWIWQLKILFLLSVISGSPTITSEKLIGSENYLSWSASVELWFMGQGYEDHLITPEDVIPSVDKVHWKKIDAQLCNVLYYGSRSIQKIFFIFGLTRHVLSFGIRQKFYTRMLSNAFLRWLLLLLISDNKTWIYLIILARLPLLRRSS